jgi:hypothetical protein
VNVPFSKLKPTDRVGVLGRGKTCLTGYKKENPIVAGIGLMTHPSEWPDLCQQYPVQKYLQHSAWANEVYKPYYGERCQLWPVGIDTNSWQPSKLEKQYDILIYNKIRWNKPQYAQELLAPIHILLHSKGLRVVELKYGSYTPEEFYSALQLTKAMIFLCEHESQGIALCESLSMNVPVLAWDQGWCLDPNRFKWGTSHIRATSVPFFDERCGMKFVDSNEFLTHFDHFWEKVQKDDFQPRKYILENLTLEKCAQHYIDIINSVQP